MFSLTIIELVGGMKGAVGQILGKQILRSATSIGANYREALRAESKSDFIHKIAIASKEASETEYWLELICESKISPSGNLLKILNESRELKAILISIGKNTKENMKKTV